MDFVKVAVLLMCAAAVNATGVVPGLPRFGRPFLNPLLPVETSPLPTPPPPPPPQGIEAQLSATVKEGELSATLNVEQRTPVANPTEPEPVAVPAPPPVPAPAPPTSGTPTLPGTNTAGSNFRNSQLFKNAFPGVTLPPTPPPPPPPAPVADGDVSLGLSATVKDGELTASAEVSG